MVVQHREWGLQPRYAQKGGLFCHALMRFLNHGVASYDCPSGP
jgi:hypothetical protein